MITTIRLSAQPSSSRGVTGPWRRGKLYLAPPTTATCGPVGTFDVGIDPQSVAFHGTNMWLPNDIGNTVTELSPTGTTLGTFPVGHQPRGIAFDGMHLWVANGQSNTVTER